MSKGHFSKVNLMFGVSIIFQDWFELWKKLLGNYKTFVCFVMKNSKKIKKIKLYVQITPSLMKKDRMKGMW